MAIEVSLPNGILDIKSGVIVHQVNCRNVIGGGLSGKIIKMYPQVKDAYHSLFAMGFEPQKEILGCAQDVKVSDTLTIVNLFSQYNYGNSSITGKRYTDYDLLVNGIKRVIEKHPNEKIYIPKYIGCGLGGGNWDVVYKMIKNLNVTIISLS